MNRRGYTLIEMLLVLSLWMVMMLLTVRMVPLNPILRNQVKHSIIMAIEQCRQTAITEQRVVFIEFYEHSIVVDGLPYFENDRVSFHPVCAFRFNAKGHITKAGTVDVYLHKQLLKLIFNVGYGAYRFEGS